MNCQNNYQYRNLSKKTELKISKKYLKKHQDIVNRLVSYENIDNLTTKFDVKLKLIVSLIKALARVKYLKFELNTEKYKRDYSDIIKLLNKKNTQKSISEKTGISLVTINKISVHFKKIKAKETEKRLDNYSDEKIINAYNNRELNLSHKNDLVVLEKISKSDFNSNLKLLLKYKFLLKEVKAGVTQRKIAEKHYIGLNTVNKVSKSFNLLLKDKTLRYEYKKNKNAFFRDNVEKSKFGNHNVLINVLEIIFSNNYVKDIDDISYYLDGANNIDKGLEKDITYKLLNRYIYVFQEHKKLLVRNVKKSNFFNTKKGKIYNKEFLSFYLNDIAEKVIALDKLNNIDEVDYVKDAKEYFKDLLLLKTKKILFDELKETDSLHIIPLTHKEKVEIKHKNLRLLLNNRLKEKIADLKKIDRLELEDKLYELIITPILKKYNAEHKHKEFVQKWVKLKLKKLDIESINRLEERKLKRAQRVQENYKKYSH